MTQLSITKMKRVPDPFGGFTEEPISTQTFEGVLDMMAHNPYSTNTMHLTDTSTHVFIMDYFDDYEEVLQPGQSLKAGNKAYKIVFADNPLNENYHLEVYLKAEVV